MRALREHKKRRQSKELDSTASRLSRYWLSAVDWKRKHTTITYFYYDDGRTWTGQYYITYKDFSHNLAIIFISAAAFGVGIGQILYIMFGS